MAMLRIRGDRSSLISALVSHWLDQTLQMPPPATPLQPLRPAPRRIRCSDAANAEKRR